MLYPITSDKLRYTYIYFDEYQLDTDSIRFSRLLASHPTILRHGAVRSFICLFGKFQPAHQKIICFRVFLNWIYSIVLGNPLHSNLKNSWAPSSTGTWLELLPSIPINKSFHVLFHYSKFFFEFFSPFSHDTCSLLIILSI